MIITIDGPTASGKSSLGRMLAQKLHYYYIYSGLLYRAVAYQLKSSYGYTLDTIAHPDEKQVESVLHNLRYEYGSEGERIFSGQQNITDQLKDPVIDQMSSIVSTNLFVRKKIDLWQHVIANAHNVIIDGRDAGTVVFPHADYKFFLTADPKIRAQRWYEQQQKRGNLACDLDAALAFITVRDERDSSRQHAPLAVARNGIVIDNSGMSLQETITKILEKIA